MQTSSFLHRPAPAYGSVAALSNSSAFHARSAEGRRKRAFVVMARKTPEKANTKKSGRDGTVRFQKKKGTVSLKPSGGSKAADSSASPGTMKLPFAGFFGTLKLFASSTPRDRPGRRDPNTVFVAGASGRLGSRVVRTLLEAGFKVIGGVRDVDAAEEALGGAVEEELLTAAQARNVTFASFDLLNESTIRGAVGNAGKVVFAAGAPESEIFNIEGPKKIDGLGTIALINVAAELGVEQFVLVTSLGTGKLGFPASALNLFWGILSWKKKAEEALEKSGMSYTIVRPGGMEKPKDDYKETHNVRLANRDTTFSGQVSRLQVAELVSECFVNPNLSLNKCVEVVAETTAPLVEYSDLLAGMPCEITKEEQEELKIASEEKARQVVEKTALVEDLEEAVQDIKERKAALSERVQELKSVSRDVVKENAPVVKAASQTEAAISRLREDAELKMREEAAAKAVLAAAQKAGREGRILSAEEQKEIAFPILEPEAYAEAVRKEEEAAEREAARIAAAEEAAAAKEAARAAAEEEAAAAKEAARTAAKDDDKEETVAPKTKAVPPSSDVEEEKPVPSFNPFALFTPKPAEEIEDKPEAKEATKPAEKSTDMEPAAPPPAGKKAPVKATDRMAKPPPKAALSAPKAAPPAPKAAPVAASSTPAPAVEAGTSVEARVLAEAQEAAKAKAASEEKAREAAMQKAVEEEKKKREAMIKAAEEEAAKIEAAKKEAANKAAEEEAAKKAAAMKAEEEAAAKKAAMEKARKEAEAKAKEEEEARRAKEQKAREAEKNARGTGDSQPGVFDNFGSFFSNIKAPWDQSQSGNVMAEIQSKNVKEAPQEQSAREWIDNWRKSSSEEQSAKEWIDNWRNTKQEAPKSTSEDANMEAREWIRNWRAKSLEKQLPADKKVES